MKIMWFCIPAFGHTNPTIEVVRELVNRGNKIRYYSFEMFRDKIEDTGACFISCNQYLPKLNKREEDALRKVSTTEMSVNAIRTTVLMDGMLEEEVKAFHPDLVVSDSVCFWGKLTAQKYNLPLVVSTTTFAFNQFSSRYMKYSFSEMADVILGQRKVKEELKKLTELGYHVKSALDMVSDKNDTDTIIYASESFQPAAETFDKSHFCFIGPSVKSTKITREENVRPFIYISLGTVIKDHPEFYQKCMEALENEDVDVLISCGTGMEPSDLGKIPANFKVEQSVNQMEVLGKANLFITHCGMNSASEGLYMGVPEILFPLTGEQQAVAQRVKEVGAGVMLDKKKAKSVTSIRTLVMEALNDKELQQAAQKMRADFLSCKGPKGAADFIELRGKND